MPEQRRLEAFAKDAGVEDLLGDMNVALADAHLRLPEPSFDPREVALIYVVGAPRSGTTLVSQLLARHLDVGYVDNLVARFWRRPALGIVLSHAVLGPTARGAIDYRSTHGVTEPPGGPHEFGYFWTHHLRLDELETHAPTPTHLATLDRDGLAGALERELISTCGRAVALKNPICGLFAGYLTSLHPRSIFVHVTRSRRDVAASILRSRKERYGDYAAWWSLRPSTYPILRDIDDPARQVLAQVDACVEEIQRAIAASGATSIEIDYAALCADPHRLLANVAAATSGTCRPLAPPATADIPALIERSAQPLPTPLARRLEQIAMETSDD